MATYVVDKLTGRAVLKGTESHTEQGPEGPVLICRPIKQFASDALPLHWPYAPRHDQRGRPVFNSLREVQESVSRAQHDGENVIYDH